MTAAAAAVEHLRAARTSLGIDAATNERARSPINEALCEAAERSCRAALELLDSAVDPEQSLEAYVLLADAMLPPIVRAMQAPEKEERITRVLGALRAAEYLARQHQDSLMLARVHEYASRVLAESFRGDRDANLLDAIAAGRSAVAILRDRHEADPERYPSLQVHMGNCYMKLDGPRERWLRDAVSAYSDGLAATDRMQCPRLHDVLADNGVRAKSLLSVGDMALPEKEMMARYGAKAQASLDAGDVVAAQDTMWEILQWGWSLPRTPNVWVAEAHKLIGGLLLHRGDPGQAQVHFYCAAALLSVLSDPGGPRQAALLESAKALLADALERLGQSEAVSPLCEQTSWAFGAARDLCARGGRIVESDAPAAHALFAQALAVFPYDPVALFYRGVASLAQFDLAAALSDFDVALRLRPRHVPSLANRGTVRGQLGDVDGALSDFGAVLNIDPVNPVALLNRAQILAARDDCEAAMTDIDRLLKADPQHGAGLRLQAKCFERLGRLEPPQ